VLFGTGRQVTLTGEPAMHGASPLALYTTGQRQERQAGNPMRGIGKYLFRLIVLLIVGFVGYALVADLPPPNDERAVSLPLPESVK
jgi:hypothetical protein